MGTRALLCTLDESNPATKGTLIWPSEELSLFGGVIVFSATTVTLNVEVELGVNKGILLSGTGGISGAANVKTGGLQTGRSTKTDHYTATGTDSILAFNIATAKTLTLPDAAAHDGRLLFVKNLASSSGALTLDGHLSQTVEGSITYELTIGMGMIIFSDAGNWHIVAILAGA